MLAVVTGATGHVGNTLCKALKAKGYRVRALRLSGEADVGALDEGVDEVVEGNTLDAQCMKELVRGARFVFHLAAIISIDGDPSGIVRRVNVGGTRNVVRACLEDAGSPRMIYFSSIHALQDLDNSRVVDESTPFVGPDAFHYDRSKADGERAVLAAVEEAGLDAITVNPAGIQGPGDYFGTSPCNGFLLDLLDGGVSALPPGGYNWVDVRDVVRSCIVAAETAPKGARYLLPGHYVSNAEMCAIWEKVSGAPAPRFRVPLWVLQATILLGLKLDRSMTRESLHITQHGQSLCGAKAERELGHTARPTEETLRDLYKWSRGRKRVKAPPYSLVETVGGLKNIIIVSCVVLLIVNTYLI